MVLLRRQGREISSSAITGIVLKFWPLFKNKSFVLF